MSPVRVAIAGSSGSIGTQTIDVVRAEAGRYQVVGLGVGSSVDVLIEQALELRPEVVAVADVRLHERVAAALPFAAVVADLADLADVADVVVNAVVGFAGLPVTVRTLAAGKRLALANKESLIAAGPVVQPLRATPGAELVPVDSEHCAVHQCLRSSAAADREVARVVLTASGGPFRGRTADELADVTVAQALAHPTWSMGPKITIDSSTLMNKGLEVIEAHELFGTPYDRIEVVVHPQSVVHSMVEFTDGSTIAQLSMPDMRLPIGYALAHPYRIGTPFGRIDWSSLARLDFGPPDTTTFRCLPLAYAAGRTGSTAPAWLSAANEVAVEAFLAGRLRWPQIADVCDAVLQQWEPGADDTVDAIVAADARARTLALQVIHDRETTTHP
jgi:1-deoxy-D-xylulose-5-phosphate reductoisomerase